VFKFWTVGVFEPPFEELTMYDIRCDMLVSWSLESGLSTAGADLGCRGARCSDRIEW